MRSQQSTASRLKNAFAAARTHARTDGRTTRKHNASDPKHKMLFTSLRITYFSALSFECAQQESLYDWHTSSGHVVSLPSPILALLNATVRQRRVYKLHTTCSMEWKNVDNTHHGAICMSPYRSADNPTTNS